MAKAVAGGAGAVGALEVSPPGVPKKWILKGEAPSHETAWVSIASGILDLWFQWKELLLIVKQTSRSITLSCMYTLLLLGKLSLVCLAKDMLFLRLFMTFAKAKNLPV